MTHMPPGLRRAIMDGLLWTRVRQWPADKMNGGIIIEWRGLRYRLIALRIYDE